MALLRLAEDDGNTMVTPAPIVTQSTVAPITTPVQPAIRETAEQERPSSPDTTDAEPEPESIPQPNFVSQARGRSSTSQAALLRRDRSRSPHTANPEPRASLARLFGSLRFRLDNQPITYTGCHSS